MELTPAQREQRRLRITETLNVLAKLPDPGRVYDIVEMHMLDREYPIGFSDHLEPLNWLVGMARRDFDSFKDLFWSGFIPALVERKVLLKKDADKARRRAYQRSFMRDYRAYKDALKAAQREALPEPEPVEKPKLDNPEVKSLEDLLGALPDDDELPQ